MSLVKDYCITRDKKDNYILQFNTSENASVVYSTERDGTNAITVKADTKGTTSFTKNYGNASKIFKYMFYQQNGTARAFGEPGGTMGP